MIIEVRLLDIWREHNSRRVIVRDGRDPRLCSLVSVGTGESSKPMSDKEMFDYLVYGKNPRKVFFFKELNLRDKFKEELPGFANFPYNRIWKEDITDEAVLKHREEEYQKIIDMDK